MKNRNRGGRVCVGPNQWAKRGGTHLRTQRLRQKTKQKIKKYLLTEKFGKQEGGGAGITYSISSGPLRGVHVKRKAVKRELTPAVAPQVHGRTKEHEKKK